MVSCGEAEVVFFGLSLGIGAGVEMVGIVVGLGVTG
jgi:hypothetical protein